MALYAQSSFSRVTNKKPGTAQIGAARTAQNVHRTELILIPEKNVFFGFIKSEKT